MHKACSIHVHSRTKRLADADGRSCKSVIDGLVEAGILEDDNPKCVWKVSQSQEQIKGDEETIIDLEWLANRRPAVIVGTWAKDDIRRVFVDGAKWWEWQKEGATMWNSDVKLAEEEATKRYDEQEASCEV